MKWQWNSHRCCCCCFFSCPWFYYRFYGSFTRCSSKAAAPAAAASVLISCFILISTFWLLIFDLNFDFHFVTLILHIGVMYAPRRLCSRLPQSSGFETPMPKCPQRFHTSDGTSKYWIITWKRLDKAKLDGAWDLSRKLPKSINEIWTVFKLINKLPKNYTKNTNCTVKLVLKL